MTKNHKYPEEVKEEYRERKLNLYLQLQRREVVSTRKSAKEKNKQIINQNNKKGD